MLFQHSDNHPHLGRYTKVGYKNLTTDDEISKTVQERVIVSMEKVIYDDQSNNASIDDRVTFKAHFSSDS